MNVNTEVKVPERPSSFPGVSSDLVVIPPVTHPGKYLHKGELLFCVDIGIGNLHNLEWSVVTSYCNSFRPQIRASTESTKSMRC